MSYTKHINEGTIMRPEIPQNKRRSFPSHGKPRFMFYYFCACRKLVLSRAVKPTPFPTISGYIIFSLPGFFDYVFVYQGGAVGLVCLGLEVFVGVFFFFE